MKWINHPRSGSPDTMLTVAIVATFIVLMKFLISGLVLSFGDKSVDFGTLDATLAGVILGGTLGAYTARKFKSPPPDKKEEE